MCMYNIYVYYILLLSFALLFTGMHIMCTYAIICHVNIEVASLIGSSCFADGGMGSSCSQKLKEWNKVNFQLSAVTLAGQVNISNASAGELKQLQEVGVDVKALQKQPCSLQVVLLPFGEKDEPLLFKGEPIEAPVWLCSLPDHSQE